MLSLMVSDIFAFKMYIVSLHLYTSVLIIN
jgi:hypothetical protein